MLPVKLHLKSWEEKLHLKDENKDSFEQRKFQQKEEKFDHLIESLYSMEWNKMREQNAQEFNFLKSTIFKKIQKA